MTRISVQSKEHVLSENKIKTALKWHFHVCEIWGGIN